MPEFDIEEKITSQLCQRFPDLVEPEPGKEGAFLVGGEHLPEVATYLRDRPDLPWDCLSSVTGVDYPNYFEVVYHLYSVEKQVGPLVLKVRTEKEDPVVPSLVSVWPGANFQEREVYDLMGIRFSGHPNLKRILLWEGYRGHPLRKDYQGEEN